MNNGPSAPRAQKRTVVSCEDQFGPQGAVSTPTLGYSSPKRPTSKDNHDIQGFFDELSHASGNSVTPIKNRGSQPYHIADQFRAHNDYESPWEHSTHRLQSVDLHHRSADMAREVKAIFDLHQNTLLKQILSPTCTLQDNDSTYMSLSPPHPQRRRTIGSGIHRTMSACLPLNSAVHGFEAHKFSLTVNTSVSTIVQQVRKLDMIANSLKWGYDNMDTFDVFNTPVFERKIMVWVIKIDNLLHSVYERADGVEVRGAVHEGIQHFLDMRMEEKDHSEDVEEVTIGQSTSCEKRDRIWSCSPSDLPKSHLLRQPKGSTEHALLRRYIPYIVDVYLLHIRRDGVSHLPRQLLANFFLLLDVIVALGAEAVYMQHGHLPAFKKLLDLVNGHAGHVSVQPDKAGHEVYARGGQVHDVVVEDARLGQCFKRCGFCLWRVGARELGLGHDVDRVLGVQKLVRRCADEIRAIAVKGAHVVADFVKRDVVGQTLVALWVQVIGPYETVLFPCWHCEGTYACCDVADCLSLLEDGAESLVLGVQARVPVNFGKVELEGATLLVDFNVEVIFSNEDLILKGAECILAADVVELVDYGLHHRVLVGKNGSDQVLIRPVALAQIEVGDMAGQGETLWYLIVVLLLGWGNGCACNFRVREIIVVKV